MYQSFSSSIMLFDYRTDHCLEYNGCSCNWRCYGARRPRQSREVLREYKEFRFWKDFRAISCQRLFSCPFAAYRQRRVGKMHGTFKSGRGSKKSYGKGFKVGYGRSSWHYGSFSGSPAGASLGLSKQASSENPGHEHPRTQPYDKRYSMNKNYGKNYGKRYR